MDAGFGIAAAVDGVLLRSFTGVAVAERVLALGSTFVLMLAVGVAGTVDAADPAGAAGSVDVGAAEGATGIAMVIAPLFSGTVSEVEFSVKAAI